MIEKLAKKYLENLRGKSFSELNQDVYWKEVPIMLKKVFLKINLDNYSNQDKDLINDWLDNKNHYHNSSKKEDIAAQITEFLEYYIKNIRVQFTSEKILVLLKFKETKLRDFIHHVDEEVLAIVFDYIDKKVDILEKVKNNAFVDESDVHFESKENYKRLKFAFFENHTYFHNLLELKGDVNIKAILDCFINLYFKIPKLEGSNKDFYQPYSLAEIKKVFSKISVKKNIPLKDLKDLIRTLEILRTDLKNYYRRGEKQICNLDPRLFITIDRTHMIMDYNEKRIIVINHFIQFLKTSLVKRNITKVKPNKFEEIITDIKKFRKILNDLKIKNFIKKKDGKYTWAKRSSELLEFLYKLNELNLLQDGLDRKTSYYSKLICIFFDVKFSSGSFRPTKFNPQNTTFKFLNYYKSDK